VNRTDFDDFCASLPAVENVVQWGNASVWKVGGKIFAICSHWGPGETEKISFKCSDLTYAILSEQEGIVPAPYLARAKWVQLVLKDAMTEDDIKAYIEKAYSIIKAKLTKAVRAKLGI
jgi:predicted DNA-binding protein (MmcQ/YjbR family)|tara:strand:- start:42419 stop:42772 length:354 start_codon:yes stop_codon:yes gene_type:complete